MIYNALDEINGLLGKGRHFSEGAREVPPEEVSSVLRPADNEPCRELGEGCSERGSSMCKGSEVGPRLTCHGESQGMIVSQ